METIPNNHLSSFTNHLIAQYGEHGTLAREEFEAGFEAFKFNAIRQELRQKKRRTKRNSSAQQKN